MWDPKHNIVGTKEKNRMEHARNDKKAENRLLRRVHDGIPEAKRNRGRPMKNGKTHWNKQATGL